MGRPLPLLAAFVALLALVPAPGAAAQNLDEPFALRNQLPLNLLFLDQTPKGTRLLPPGRMRLSVHAAYENTLIASDDLFGLYRQDDFQTLDGKVTRPILEAIASGTPGRTAYFIDAEVLRTVLDVRIGVGRRFEAGIEAPFLLQGAGLFDSAIDSYHSRLGLPDGGRGSFAQDRYVVGLVRDGETVFLDRAPNGPRLGEVVLSGRVAILNGSGRRPGLAASVSVKLPTGSAARLEGSGGTDYGGTVEASERLGRSTLNIGYGYARPGGWALAPRIRPGALRSQFGAYVFSLSERNALLVQVLRSSGPLAFHPGSDLGRVSLEIAAGARHLFKAGRALEWAVIENLDSYQNTPDIGFFAGVTFRARE